LIVFTHIPKTAGTSLRWAFAKYFDQNRCFYDYGVSSEVTSSVVNEFIYQEGDHWGLYKTLKESHGGVLAGHFAANKYLSLFGLDSMVSIVRDPVERVLSEYYHFKIHHNYQGSFTEFYHEERFVNRQSKLLNKKIWPLMALVGITEAYDETIEYMNKHFGLQLEVINTNVRPDNANIQEVNLCEERKAIEKLNLDDINLYAAVNEQFKLRMNAQSLGRPFYRGMLDSIKKKVIQGSVLPVVNDDPVEVEILINDQSVAIVNANEIRHHLKGISSIRGGYVGFSYLAEDLKEDDLVSCRVRSTNQLIVNSPYRATTLNL
tara:strand:+ start:9150 stop:10106 length:957 start_codon:yes stop_codon:yes gene_type:complete